MKSEHQSSTEVNIKDPNNQEGYSAPPLTNHTINNPSTHEMVNPSNYQVYHGHDQIDVTKMQLQSNQNVIIYSNLNQNDPQFINTNTNLPLQSEINGIHPIMGSQPQIIVIKEVHKVESKERSLYPKLDNCTAILILILNIFFPGIGTMIIGCVAGHDQATWICIGLAQMLLACIFFIGWIWAIVTGVVIVLKSKNKSKR